MASDHPTARRSFHSLLVKLLELETYPSESFSPRKVSSSPRSSLDMIMESEEEPSDVTLDVILECKEEAVEALPTAVEEAGARGQCASEKHARGGGGAEEGGGEEESLKECFTALAAGTEWAAVRYRTADLYAARFPHEPAKSTRRRGWAPLPGIPEAEEGLSTAHRDSQGSLSAGTEPEFRKMCSEPYPSTEVRRSPAFEATLATVFEVEEQFLEPDLRLSCSNEQGRTSLAAVFRRCPPRRCAGLVPSLTPVVEARQAKPQALEPFMAVYPVDLVNSRPASTVRRAGLTSVNEAAEEMAVDGAPKGLQPGGRSGLQCCSAQLVEQFARKRAFSLKDALPAIPSVRMRVLV